MAWLATPTSLGLYHGHENRQILFLGVAIAIYVILCTPLKFNMEPENGGLEDDFPFQLGVF